MYYLEPYFHAWIIKDGFNEDFLFGPFESEADAWFIVEMLKSGKIQFSKDVENGKEGIEEPHSVY